MSTTVDQRVVEMRFDNKQFEQNIKTSLSTIEKLKRSLNLEGAAKGLENVNSAAQKCNMTPLTNAVETVRVKFSALEVMAVTALANITNSAINAGERIVSALTIDPIKSGFEEYETQINAIQTIMSNTRSKGTTLDQVNNALDELNHYADMTIYNFTEMTRNIGTFTAAGVDLDTSVSAIKGIANLAAVSGSTSQQASTAMYQLSQALAAGTVKLQDWNSVVNAGMGGQVFQDALKETARVHGIAIDAMIEKNGSFRETLSKGWLTSEILTETLSKFTGDLTEAQIVSMGYTKEQAAEIIAMGKDANDAATKVKTFTQLFDTLKEAAQSGWTQSWQLIVGDFEEAKALLTEVSDTFSAIINASSDARNNMLQDWKDLGGRTMLIESVKNVFEGLVSVVKPIREAFDEIFPPMTGKQLADITEKVRDLTAKFKMGEETSKDLKNTCKGVFAVLDIGGQALKAVASGVGELIGLFLPAGNGVLSLTGNFGEYLVKLDETVTKTDIFGKAVSTVVNVIKTIVTSAKTATKAIQDFAVAMSQKFNFPGMEVIHSFLERVHERMSQVGDAAGKMKSGVTVAFELMGEALEKCKFRQVLEALWKAVTSIGGAIGELLGSMVESIGKADFNGVIDLLNGIATGGLFVAISNFLNSKSEKNGIFGFIESLVESPLSKLDDMLAGVKGVLDGVRESFEAYQTNLKAGTLIKISVAIGILAAAIATIASIDSEKLSASLGAITVLFGNLLGAMAIFNKISGSGGNVKKASGTMIAMSVAVAILAGALKKVADLEWDELGRGLLGIGGLAAIVVASAKIMSSGSGQLVKGASSLIIFAVAIKVLASVCKDLSSLQWDELEKGLTGVGVLLAEVAVFLRIAKFGGKAISTATGIVILATAMKILASACKDFGQMEWSEIGKGLTAIGVLLAEVVAFTNLSGSAKHVISTGVALVAIGAAMKIFASAVADFGVMQWDQIGRGLAAMGGALAEVAIAVKLLPKNMISISLGLVIVGGALEIMADVMAKFGGMQWDEIGRGLTVMGGALAELAIALNLMKGTLGGSASLLVAAAALAVLTPVFSVLGALSWEAIAKGLTVLAGAFTVIGVAGALLTPLVPTILALAGAFALIGVGVLTIGAGLLAAGVGLSALAVGFTALATAGAAGATAIVAALTVIITGIAGLIPIVIGKIGEGIVAFCRAIGESAPAIGAAVTEVVLALIGVVVECVPQIADGVLALVAGVLEALVNYTPQIVDSIFKFLIGVLEGIANNLPGLIQAAVAVLMSFFSGLVDALRGIDVNVLLKGIVGIGLLSGIMIALSAVAALVPGAMLGILGMGAVVAELALVLAAVGAFAQLPGLSWLIGEGGKLLQEIGTAIGQFVGGIVGGFMSGVSSQFPQIGSDLSAFMENVQPFVEGASKIQPSMMDGVKALAETILILTAADILQGLTSWFTGGSSLSKFGEELVPFGQAMSDFSVALGDMDGELVANAAIAGKALAEMAAALPNSGGLISFFTGNNDMADFGEQLVPFGEALRDYGDAVDDLKVDAIEASIPAGKALSELADTLPNTGGLIGFFTGNNDMGAFGIQLVAFGAAMTAYSLAITGLETEAVVNSTVAGKALTELANTIPNCGGLVSFFTGNNDMATFGLSLISFGENFKAYSDYMTDVDSGIITATTSAAASIVELQKSLPKDGGWFSDDMTLADFGKDMSSFGKYFSSFYGYISEMDTGVLSGVISQMNRLVDMAKGMTDLDTDGMNGFGSALTTLARTGIDEFINTFTNANERVMESAGNLIQAFIDGVNLKLVDLTTMFTTLSQTILTFLNNTEQQLSFNLAGQTLMMNFVMGLYAESVLTSMTNAMNLLLNGMLIQIVLRYPQFNLTGQTVIIQLIAGIMLQEVALLTACAEIVDGAVTQIREQYQSFYDAGAYLVEGFANGITANTFMAEARARAMAKAAAKAAEQELGIHSPSRVGYGIGNYFGLGFINAIDDYAVKAYNASTEMADSARNGLTNAISKVSDFIDGKIDAQPTIRPVLDLSDITSGVSRLNTMFNRQQALAIDSSRNGSASSVENQNEVSGTSGNTYQFTQNNYSPKALSRVEIYRQTKNQFSAMERAVEA